MTPTSVRWRRRVESNSITLVGMMGAGKTTVGRALAERLGWRFIDSDEQIQSTTGQTVAEIWKSQGEQGFRRLETAALADALASTADRPAVVAGAGGIVIDPRNRELLRRHPPVIWLRGRVDTLADRVASKPGHRPLLDQDPVRVLAQLNGERAGLYEEVADHTVDVDDLAPGQVVDEVLATVGDR